MPHTLSAILLTTALLLTGSGALVLPVDEAESAKDKPQIESNFNDFLNFATIPGFAPNINTDTFQRLSQDFFANQDQIVQQLFGQLLSYAADGATQRDARSADANVEEDDDYKEAKDANSESVEEDEAEVGDEVSDEEENKDTVPEEDV